MVTEVIKRVILLKTGSKNSNLLQSYAILLIIESKSSLPWIILDFRHDVARQSK